ncbi:NAD(P)H-quinone oxidoreductase [Crenobacter intestini]|uniref:NAD(P)H-quinone oxidoreductase n=1 Tax=Crenobacter intestini TaxID=2563443 RepID=A0A4T0V7G9_9NEIS|nr:NAD(P)H-quinone oxidoreductase [Crenobacter intestini]TIC87246.1 NAD(P)H-quinone oxidoreductase [Crenobacter intestini]
MLMRAVLQGGPGGADTLYLGELPRPEPGPGELLVRVMAAGVNRADIVQREGHYPPPPGASSVLGLEVAGVVEAAGEGASRFAKGDAVFGLVAGGGYAEYVLLDEALAIAKPASLGWAEAASLPEVWMTAWLNLVEVAQLAPGERFLVHAGASGVGAAAIQLARMLGADVLASSSSDEKLEFCRMLGAQTVFNARRDGAFSGQLKATGGVDVILDPVGASYFRENLASLNTDGRLVLIGVMGGRNAELNLGLLLVKRLRVMGSTLRTQPLEVKARLAAALEARVLPALARGEARVTLDAVFALEAVADAHRHLEENNNLGKVVLDLSNLMQM